MRRNRLSTLLEFVVLCAFVQLLAAALGGSAAAFIVAVAIGVLGGITANYFSILERPVWLLPTVLGCGSLLGLGIAYVLHPFAPVTWAAVPVCLFISAATVGVQTLGRHRCGLCNRRLSPKALVFTCPRCALRVCEENCWSFEHRRCQLCVEQKVPLLSAQKQWWDRTLGPAVVQGRCHVCLTSFDQADLRTCGNCRRSQCRDCWDNLNGECARCGWTIPDLPKSLNMIITSDDVVLSSQHHE